MKIVARETKLLYLIIFFSLLFSAFTYFIQYTQNILSFSQYFIQTPLSKLVQEFTFLYLVFTILFVYYFWQEAYKKYQKLETIIDSISPDTLIVIDNKRKIIKVTSSVKRLFGYSPKELHHQKTDQLYFDRRLRPDTPHEIYDALEKEGFHIGLATGRKKNGTTFPIEIITGKMEDDTGAVLLLRDITERKKTEDALRTNEALFQLVTENVSDVIWTFDMQLNIQYVSSSIECLLGYSTQEIMSKSIRRILYLESFSCIKKMLQESRSQDLKASTSKQGTKTLELLLKRNDGSTVWTETTITFLHNSDDEAYLILCVTRNIAVRKELDTKKDEFISTVSHEIRTPLAIIKESVSLLEESILGPLTNEQHKVINGALENTNRLIKIINSLLDISKIESGKAKLEKKPVNMINLINAISTSFLPRLNKKNIVLKLSYSNEDITTQIDETKISQVVSNILDNAVKFSNEGTIEISIQKEASSIVCSIKDSGVGLPQEYLQRIFDKFQQFDRIPGAGEKGTGLGLAIAKRFIEMHNGTIKASSSIGKGTTISFTLPR